MLQALTETLGPPGVVAVRVAWFRPSFHAECGVVLLPDGSATFCTEVRREGAPVASWLSPVWSREPVGLPASEHAALVAAFDRPPDAPDGIMIDGCSFELQHRSELAIEVRRGNLGNSGEGPLLLAQAVVEAARTRARWRSTRTAFEDLARYVD